MTGVPPCPACSAYFPVPVYHPIGWPYMRPDNGPNCTCLDAGDTLDCPTHGTQEPIDHAAR